MNEVTKKQKAELQAYKPIEDITIVFNQSVTPRHIVKANRPTIAKISKQIGNENVIKSICLALAKSISLSGVPSLSNEQLQAIAREINNNWRNLSIADISLCLKNGCMGYYGQFYGRIGIDTIVGQGGWFSMYSDARAEEVEKIHHNKKHTMKQDHKGLTFEEWKAKNPDKYQERLNKIRLESEKFKKKPVFRSIEHYCKSNEIDFNEYKKELINDWENWYENEQPKETKDVFFAQCELLHLADLNQK